MRRCSKKRGVEAEVLVFQIKGGKFLACYASNLRAGVPLNASPGHV